MDEKLIFGLITGKCKILWMCLYLGANRMTTGTLARFQNSTLQLSQVWKTLAELRAKLNKSFFFQYTSTWTEYQNMTDTCSYNFLFDLLCYPRSNNAVRTSCKRVTKHENTYVSRYFGQGEIVTTTFGHVRARSCDVLSQSEYQSVLNSVVIMYVHISCWIKPSWKRI